MSSRHKTPKKLVQQGYRPRLVEGRLDHLMCAYGCVEVTGPLGCGKTWLALSRCRSVTYLGDATERAVAEVDPTLALVGDEPHLVDEWQEVPAVRDAATRLVSLSRGRKGLLLLTGSSVKPREAKTQYGFPASSVGHLRLRPLTLQEAGVSSGEVSLSGLFKGQDLPAASCKTSLADVVDWCVRGGWPAGQALDTSAAAMLASRCLGQGIEKGMALEGRSPEVARALVRAISSTMGGSPTHADLLSAMGSDAVCDTTLVSYLDLLSRCCLTEELPGWVPGARPRARVRVAPKRYLADPSLAVSARGLSSDALLGDMPTLDMLFESLCVRDLLVYISAYPGRGNAVSHYRDENGLAVDLVLEHAGSWAAIEVELGEAKADAAAKRLTHLRRKLTADPTSRTPEPAFLAVLVGVGEGAYRRHDGVLVIPMACLGA